MQKEVKPQPRAGKAPRGVGQAGGVHDGIEGAPAKPPTGGGEVCRIHDEIKGGRPNLSGTRGAYVDWLGQALCLPFFIPPLPIDGERRRRRSPSAHT